MYIPRNAVDKGRMFKKIVWRGNVMTKEVTETL